MYASGAARGKFLGFWQRSLYNVQGLKVEKNQKSDRDPSLCLTRTFAQSQPVWTKDDFGPETSSALSALEHNWSEIREEALEILDQVRRLSLERDRNALSLEMRST